ncbi:hypothetical protein RFN25_30720 [Mesorhizobium abyssinicae]|uniref:hypothetical protein n=1 Tax=Mesorhizobium abyssinicae TaxID=1209958 RepID=UPI002A24C9C2|nr:hypothetical protein [Mesorhizobium abyssinicae]MDX8437779.1 hypothetical protein [Mesorhizobium abyssinicae]
MDPVDLDQIDTWPEEIVLFLEATATELRAERLADHKYTLSDTMHRLLNPSPPMHRWDEAKALITPAMANRDLRAFHATRLVDFESIRENGLLRLNPERDILRLKAALAVHMSPSEVMQVDAAVSKMIEADSHFVRREGAVWMTPLRRFLHNGGCEVFFESFGGKAVERIADYAGGKLGATLKQVGHPAVVVARFPAYGWCRFTEHRLPQSMIELYLEDQGDWEPMDYSWDIMIQRDIPREAIEAVVRSDDPMVSD